MSPDQQHTCFVRAQEDGQPYLFFAPTSGLTSSFSNSLFTLDLKPGTTLQEADALAVHVNNLLRGVSATVF